MDTIITDAALRCQMLSKDRLRSSGIAIEVEPRFAIRERLQVARRGGVHPHRQTKLLRIYAWNPFQYALVNANRKGTALLKYWKRRSQ